MASSSISTEKRVCKVYHEGIADYDFTRALEPAQKNHFTVKGSSTRPHEFASAVIRLVSMFTRAYVRTTSVVGLRV